MANKKAKKTKVKSCPINPCNGPSCNSWHNCEARKDGRQGGSPR